MKIQLSSREKILLLFILVLLGPALLINLGFMTHIDDESIRSLVGMEMYFSGNYITPTLNGEFYYNKPPLFNWILLFWNKIFGNFGEFSARFQTFISVLGFAAAIFFSFKKQIGTKAALLTALGMITCGRILFEDSLHALIDITFSWVIFGIFIVVYNRGEEKKYLQLFLWAYFLTAVGFLFKGLPSIVFLGGTLFTYFIFFNKNRKKLLSLEHLLGILIFMVIVGGYYLLYNRQNELSQVFSKLLTESTKRTPVNFSFGKTVLHFISFPFEMVYHFLPWSFLSILLLHKKSIAWIRENRFVTYLSLTFLVNILVYWISPQVYPRYLIMFIPIYFGVLFYLFEKHMEVSSFHPKIIYTVFGILIVAVGLLIPSIPIWDRLDFLENRILITVLLSVLLIPLVSLYFIWKSNRFLIFIAVLLVVRLAFNLIVLPDRNHNDFGNELRQHAIEAGKYFKDKELYILGNLDLNMTNSYYLSRESNRIIRVSHTDPESGKYYIINPKTYQGPAFEKLFDLKVRHPKKQTFYIIKIN